MQDPLVEISPQRLFGRTSLLTIFGFPWVDFFLKRLLVGISLEIFFLRDSSDRFVGKCFLVENVSSEVLG